MKHRRSESVRSRYFLWFITFASFLLGISVVPIQATSTMQRNLPIHEGWKRFTDDTFSMTVDIPSTWTISQFDLPEESIHEVVIGSEGAERVSIAQYSNPERFSAQQWFMKNRKQYHATLVSEMATIKSPTGSVLVLGQPDTCQTAPLLVAIVSHNDAVSTFTFSDLANNILSENWIQVLQQIAFDKHSYLPDLSQLENLRIPKAPDNLKCDSSHSVSPSTAINARMCPGASMYIPTTGEFQVPWGCFHDTSKFPCPSYWPGKINHPHAGIDIMGKQPAGVTPVYTPFNGIAHLKGVSTVYIEFDPPFTGQSVYLTHMASADGKTSYRDVTEGARVEAGITQIGRQGKYDTSIVHLHTSFLNNASGNEAWQTLDPTPFLQAAHLVFYEDWNHQGSLECLNSDTIPPTVVFTPTVSAAQWYSSNQVIAWSITDNSGGSGVRGYKYAWDQSPPAGPEYNASSGLTNLGEKTEGQHKVYVQAWDKVNNSSAVTSAGWFGYDIRPPYFPTSPMQVSAGCSALNDTWQNACNDPSFTWSSATDGNGIGVKDYHYYWGGDQNGNPNSYTTSASFDPPPISGGAAEYYLRTAIRDQINHESETLNLFTFKYDAIPPTGTITINQGALSANQIDVMLNLSVTDIGSGVAKVHLSNNNGIQWSDWRPYAPEISWKLPALDRRDLPVSVEVQDRAGNISGIFSDTIYFDLNPVAPHSPSFRLCQSAINSAGRTTLTSTGYLLASSVGQFVAGQAQALTSTTYAAQSGFLANQTGCLPIEFTETHSYTLGSSIIASAGSLRTSAGYRVGDTVGQPLASGGGYMSSTTYVMLSGFWSTFTGTLPTRPANMPAYTPLVAPPTPPPPPTPTPQPATFGLIIESDQEYVNTPSVNVRTWGPNVTELALSNSSNFASAVWQPYQVNTTWVLSVPTAVSSPTTVFGRYRTAFGNEYGTYFDYIDYDPVAPQAEVMLFFDEGMTATLWLDAWDDYSGIAEMRISEDPTFTGAAWQSYINQLDWLYSGNVVYVQFRDRAGNLSLIYTSDETIYNPDEKKVFLPLILK